MTTVGILRSHYALQDTFRVQYQGSEQHQGCMRASVVNMNLAAAKVRFGVVRWTRISFELETLIPFSSVSLIIPFSFLAIVALQPRRDSHLLFELARALHITPLWTKINHFGELSRL
jgi:hypothetical protein